MVEADTVFAIEHPCAVGFLRWLADMPGQKGVQYTTEDIIDAVENPGDWQVEFALYMEQRSFAEPLYAKLRLQRNMEQCRASWGAGKGGEA